MVADATATCKGVMLVRASLEAKVASFFLGARTFLFLYDISM